MDGHLGFVELAAKGFELFVEPHRSALCGREAAHEVVFDIGLGVVVGHGSGEGRAGVGKFHLDHAAIFYWFDFDSALDESSGFLVFFFCGRFSAC